MNRSKKFRVALVVAGLLVIVSILVCSRSEWVQSHLASAPDRQDFEDESAFIEACVRYHIAQWLNANHGGTPEHHELYELAHPPIQREDNQWVGYAGPGVISGPYIEVIVDASGSLVAVNERHAEL